MKVILFGSTGMVGQGVLRECLRDPDVTEVLAVMRTGTGQQRAKLREIVHGDFNDFSSLPLDGDACFWCLGVTSAGMSEADYTRITHDYAIAAARRLAPPTTTFVFVSGAGAQGRSLWARVNRKTAEALLAMPFKQVYVFRPGLIQPLPQTQTPTPSSNPPF